MITSDLLDEQCCSCHTMAPCSFCTDMDEGEANAYCNGGIDGLWKYLREREDKEKEIAELNQFINDNR